MEAAKIVSTDAVNFMSTCLSLGCARNAQQAYTNGGARVIGIGLGAKGLGVQCELSHNSTENRLGEMRFQVREERDVGGVAVRESIWASFGIQGRKKTPLRSSVRESGRLFTSYDVTRNW